MLPTLHPPSLSRLSIRRADSYAIRIAYYVSRTSHTSDASRAWLAPGARSRAAAAPQRNAGRQGAFGAVWLPHGAEWNGGLRTTSCTNGLQTVAGGGEPCRDRVRASVCRSARGHVERVAQHLLRQTARDVRQCAAQDAAYLAGVGKAEPFGRTPRESSATPAPPPRQRRARELDAAGIRAVFIAWNPAARASRVLLRSIADDQISGSRRPPL
jgi:hypothetical protein